MQSIDNRDLKKTVIDSCKRIQKTLKIPVTSISSEINRMFSAWDYLFVCFFVLYQVLFCNTIAAFLKNHFLVFLTYPSLPCVLFSLK